MVRVEVVKLANPSSTRRFALLFSRNKAFHISECEAETIINDLHDLGVSSKVLRQSKQYFDGMWRLKLYLHNLLLWTKTIFFSPKISIRVLETRISKFIDKIASGKGPELTISVEDLKKPKKRGK